MSILQVLFIVGCFGLGYFLPDMAIAVGGSDRDFGDGAKVCMAFSCAFIGAYLSL
ncbi:MAG: hypothetical protein IT327_03060 [Anaerolineae bacterium]|jgi:hypothetical protein|nr:hypothetical protein [Anaerolineae bacterium]